MDNTVDSILDRYCSIQERSKFASNRRDGRYLSDDAVDAKRIEELEWKWKSPGKEVDYMAYRKACRSSNKLIVSPRQEFYRKRIRSAGDNPRTRWTAHRDVLHLTNTTEILTERKCSYLCDSFATYFIGKLRNIKSANKCQLVDSQADPLQSDPAYSGPVLSSLVAPSVDEVQTLLSSLPAKPFPTDCIPTIVMKSCADVFAPLIARLAVLCFDEGVFLPDSKWPV